jgi:hypothetical protein
MTLKSSGSKQRLVCWHRAIPSNKLPVQHLCFLSPLGRPALPRTLLEHLDALPVRSIRPHRTNTRKSAPVLCFVTTQIRFAGLPPLSDRKGGKIVTAKSSIIQWLDADGAPRRARRPLLD